MASKLSKSLIIDGVGASEALDSSGETLSISGLDITELEEGRALLNFEHRGPKDEGASANDNIGAITYAKKIFTRSDCANKREKMYWDQVKLPFLYIQAELFDGEGHPGAIAAAALIRYYNRRKLPILMRFSVEGSTLEREGNNLKRCLARAIAATCRPCNRTCFSGVVSDHDEAEASVDPLESLVRNEHPTRRILGSYELEVNPVVADPVELLKESLESLKEAAALSKAISAGGYSGSPDSLGGGSALQVEDVSGGKKLKSQGLAALRDWDRKTPFRKFLKHRLPDASESFIAHFVDLVDEFHLRKQETLELDLRNAISGSPVIPAEAIARIRGLTAKLQKADIIQPPAPPELHPLNSAPPANSHRFRSEHVVPGEVELISGIHSGSKLHLVGEDEKFHYVKPHAHNPDSAVQVSKLARSHEGIAYKVNAPHQAVPEAMHVHADTHGDANLYRSLDQKHLVHGLDLNRRLDAMHSDPFADPKASYIGVTKLARPESTGWFQSAHGRIGYVKPDMPSLFSKFQDGETQKKLSIPARETIYHNLAHDFFGMGAHVPNTATFRHPKTNEQMSVMEQIPGARHHEEGDDDSEFAIHQAGENGSLDKLHMMDTILGHTDRPLNWMTTDQAPFVHHIDNGYMFNYKQPVTVPGYSNYYHTNHPSPAVGGLRSEQAQIHPEAARWLMGLDGDQLGAHLERMGVPHGFIEHAKSRLHDLKTRAWAAPPTRGDVETVGKG